MSLPDFKNFTLKDWMYFVGVIITLIMSWAVLNERVEALRIDARAHEIRQEVIDQRQDAAVKEAREELKQEIRNQTQEIKQEIRDLRSYINKPTK
jgi:predicted Holliday junction resolvase-like endonuclease